MGNAEEIVSEIHSWKSLKKLGEKRKLLTFVRLGGLWFSITGIDQKRKTKYFTKSRVPEYHALLPRKPTCKERIRVDVFVQRRKTSPRERVAGGIFGVKFCCSETLAGKAATSSLFLIPAGENFYLAEAKGVVCEREGYSKVV